MHKPLRIAVVGGGPAGLTAAVILNRHGHSVRVYEAEASRLHRGQGGTLDLHADKGQVALKAAGLLAQFRAIARHEDQESRNVDPVTGQAIAGEPQPDDALDRPEIDRGVLRDLLLSVLPEGTVAWDHRLVRVLPEAEAPHGLEFADGARATADVIIGADGAWSRVRAALTGTPPAYTGVTFLEGWIDAPTPAQAALVGRGTLFAFGGAEALFVQRNGQGRLCLYAALKRSRDWLEEALAATPATTLLPAIYSGWAPGLVDLLRGCIGFVERPIWTLPADVAWAPVSGITLIGDAAHLMPPVGLGVNLAMLDAADLAATLDGQADWQDGIRRCEARIMDRARQAMREAIPGFADWFAEGASGATAAG